MKRFFLKDIAIDEIVKQTVFDLSEVEETAKKIVSDVKAEGDAALLRYTAKFDGYE